MYSGLRVIYAVLIFFVFSSGLSGQAGKSHAVTGEKRESDNSLNQYRAPSISFIKSDDPSGKYFHISLPGHHYTSTPGEPQMPALVKVVKVPSDSYVTAKISGIKSSRINLRDYGMSGMMVYPSQPESTKNEIPDQSVRIVNKKSYSQKKNIEHDTVSVNLIGRFRGTDLYEVALYPAFYNPHSGTIDLITSMQVDISYSAVKGSGITYPAEESDETVSKDFINGYSENPLGLIILTDTIFRKNLKPFIEWKTLSGYNVNVLYSGAGNAGTTFDEIKSSLSTLYNNLKSQGKAPDYLLIVGNLSIIPASGGTSNISDLYYSEFDGNGDYIPEMYSGRLPVSDTSQLRIVLKKIINYEKFIFPSSTGFLKKTVLTAGNDDAYYLYMNSQVNYLKQNYFNTSNGFESFSWKYPASALKDDSLKILINNGIGLLNYTGHGEAAGFSDPTLKVSGISSLSNKGLYPMIIANACRTAQLNATSCFGKEMLLAENKGAIGYIGCTNDSYWSEDFYWSVGIGTADLSADYSNTGLGAFDRLMHTHNEAPSDWFFTLGQMLFAGNMSVSSSTSQYKKYYWETYILLGDPTMMPYIGKADTINPVLPDTIPQELNSLSFISEPYSYVAISDFKNLWDAGFTNNSGSISLDIPQNTSDSCLIVITGQNIVPYTKTIYIGNVSSEFLVVNNISTNDSYGNNNGLCDYGERIGISLTLSNLGKSTASNIRTKLNVISGGIIVERDTLRVKELKGGESVNVTDSLFVKISDETKDLDMASLSMNFKDDYKENYAGLDFILHAPDPAVVTCIADDSETGNGNGICDPGETINLKVNVKNNGSSPSGGVVGITESNAYLDIKDFTSGTGILLPSGSATLTIPARVTMNLDPGTRIPFVVDLECGKYSASGKFSIRTGKTRETWEENNFIVFPWINKSSIPWSITSSSAYENVLSARSGQITNDSESLLAISLNNPKADTLTFHAKVSSESLFDRLIFRIDSVECMNVSGEIDWFSKSFRIQPGVHYLEWVYKKDKSLSAGADAAWIDFIDFPSYSFLNKDLAVDSVFLPPVSSDHSHDIITGRIVNLGRDTLITIPLSYKIDSKAPVDETFILKLAPGDTSLIKFTQPANFRIPGNYNIKIYNSLESDQFHSNDTAFVSYSKTTVDTIYEKDRYINLTLNPFKDRTKMIYYTNKEGIALIDIIDLNGQVLSKSQYDVVSGVNYFDLDGSGLKAGVYIIRALQDGVAVETKAVKMRKQ
jgi:hypothetical protein